MFEPIYRDIFLDYALLLIASSLAENGEEI